jgi:toxin ParE1/3/4
MAKKYRVKWTAPAREDIIEMREYISLTNPNYAVKILNKIEDHVKQLKMFPERFRFVPELEKYSYLLYREMIIEYWKVIYKIENDIVYIMLVIDGRRNLEDIIFKKIVLRENEI